jgi:spore coat polysaccharide biosynthesis protein SpsF (cytidylyltransferase family)
MTGNVIIQARMSSTRLSGKVMRKESGKPMIQYLIERVRLCRRIGTIIVATSKQPGDDIIADFCAVSGIACCRGSLENVASRFVDSLRAYPSGFFVRINGDSPLLDPALIDLAVGKYISGSYDLVTNVFPRSFPYGQSVEVVNTESFISAYPEMVLPEEFEHVTRFFYTHPESYTIDNIDSGGDLSGYNFCVDTEDDWSRFTSIVRGMTRDHREYHLSELIQLYEDLI